MQDNICMVTGANSGIGKVTALELARMGATVVMVCRNPQKGAAAQAEIRAQSGNDRVDLLLADFASLRSVRALAEEYTRRYRQLHVLVNNAGLYLPTRFETEDGYEMTLGVNHLAPFLLTNLLLDTVIASAPTRIINVSSEAHRGARINFADLQSVRKYNGFQAYGQSKLANILFTYELAQRLTGTGVTVNCVHPGAVATNFGSSDKWFSLLLTVIRPLLRTPEKGAETPIYLAASPDVAGVTSTYFKDKKPIRSSNASYRQEDWKRLWRVSEELVGLSTPASVEMGQVQ